MKSLGVSGVALAAVLAGWSGVAFAQANDEEANKALVLRLYSDVFGGQTAVADDIFSADAVHHVDDASPGPAGELKIFDDLKARIPGVVATVKHVAADGDYVGVHWQASATPENGFSGEEWADLYRLEGGKVVEHWSGHETVEPTSVSGNDPFSDLYQYANGAPTLTEEQEDANKAIVEQANARLFANRDATAIDELWGPEYFQHNPGLVNGPQALKDMVTRMAAGGAPGGAPPGGAPPGGAPGGAPPGGAPPGGAPGGPPGGPGGPGGANPLPLLADGDQVWVPNARGENTLMVDFYRVANLRIVEHWEIAPGGFGPPPGGAPGGAPPGGAPPGGPPGAGGPPPAN